MVAFTGGNLVIQTTSHLRFAAMEYVSTGSVIVCVLYFWIKNKAKIPGRRVIYKETKPRQLDWRLIMCYVYGAIFEGAIFYAITATFLTCQYAQLNAGIAQTIWGFTPFLSSILDYCMYGTKLLNYQIGGLACMITAGALISLSNVFAEAPSDPDEDLLPIYIPVLVSCTMPIICSGFGVFTRWVFTRTTMASDDLTFGYFLVYKGLAVLYQPVYFSSNQIDWKLYLFGSIGSCFDLLGCYFANAAIETGAPIGAVMALCDTQTLTMTAIGAFRMQVLPNWMQLIGLALGMIGAVVLALYHYLCKNKSC
jgi:drug/metabolite transporter (DMT)-like permease